MMQMSSTKSMEYISDSCTVPEMVLRMLMVIVILISPSAEQGKGRNQHGVRLACNARGEAVIMGDHKGGLLVLDPVLKDNCIFCNIANSFFILFFPLFIYFGCSRRREQGFPNALPPR